jgi:hypothetical protein
MLLFSVGRRRSFGGVKAFSCRALFIRLWCGVWLHTSDSNLRFVNSPMNNPSATVSFDSSNLCRPVIVY